ncbi:chloride channel protein [Chitinophaga silvatica]|uniref:Chloride channel protein n=1 Tax=Chitinophaga silvatica TaxID=2282649 RepID=A0A3E1YGV7_9BACT|nr:chloride channel protein [Chitinophaga silvatica]RFS26598.1 chloride channel protein [Chitinophaga silvatica]
MDHVVSAPYKRVFYVSFQAVCNAIVIGLVAKGLVMLISLFTNLFFYGKFSFAESSPAFNHLGVYVILIPIAGSLIVGLLARFGSKAIRGHGIPEAMENIILNESKIPPKITWLKPLSAAISIGSGGPFGAEGPIIATGGAIGSLTGQIIHISVAERKVILAAGACAGMSAIFGSPLAAILLAIELLLFEFSPRSIVPVALACITGAGMHLWLFEHSPVFAMPEIPVVSTTALVAYTVMGVLTGILATCISKSVYWVEDMFEKLPVHWMWWPAIGGAVVGIIGYFAPHTMGVGYDNIRNLLTGTLPLTILFALCVLKYLSWVIALGSGTSGGTLAPLFTIGGAWGALLGVLANRFFPELEVNIATAALIGMAALFAGSSRALLTAIVFALETTGKANGLLPLVAACSTAYFVSFFLMRGSIMTEKIRRRGVDTPLHYLPDPLQTFLVNSVMNNKPFTIYDNYSKNEAVSILEKHSSYYLQYIPIITANNTFTGYLNRDTLNSSDREARIEAAELYVKASDSLLKVVKLLHYNCLDLLAVVDDNKQLIGTISAANVIMIYEQKLKAENRYHSAFFGDKQLLRIMAKGKKLLTIR